MKLHFSILALVPLLLASCSTLTQNMETTSELPSTLGVVKIKPTDNGNSSIQLELKHLAKPERLTPASKAYILWARSLEGGAATAQNLGAIKVNDELEARLETLTPHKNFELFITGEESREAAFPTGKRLLWTKVSR